MEAKGWISGDESAKEMLGRVLSRARPFLLLPPLHRVPLRPRNVLEIVGPSPSAKTHLLIQAALTCVLPVDWNGVHYGGFDGFVIFIDLDCRFDIFRFSHLLKLRLASGSISEIDREQNNSTKERSSIAYDEELYTLCMRRFLYVRCYDSFEFLATLKTLHYRIQKEKAYGTCVHMLLIDSIGAFHWIDRASTCLPLRGNNRKSHSIQTVLETVVQEIRKLLLLHPMLAIATKATLFGNRAMNEAKCRNLRKPDTSNSQSGGITALQLPYREYMPSVWQVFHDDHLAVSDDQNHSVYFSEWLLPSLSFLDKFIVKEAGVFFVA
ncbi:DNA repair protein XRCC2 homolog isoform X3 [Quercus robur]|uniref:DNA repair protein XRCC2 homolog isoform X3 n=1 Tax=Quercus robur TaxID=38942 RepID=UPI002161B3FF|nr:DNA repair protein XRCC2 homolog isoform X3 [Quercus robur]